MVVLSAQVSLQVWSSVVRFQWLLSAITLQVCDEIGSCP